MARDLSWVSISFSVAIWMYQLMGIELEPVDTMNTLSFLKDRSSQLEPADLYPLDDLTQIESKDQTSLHRHFPHFLSERLVDIGQSDKVFASVWLSEDLFLLGTKSNQVRAPKS